MLSDKISSKTVITISLSKKQINNCITKLSNKVKDIDIKNWTYYFFNDIINTEKFDSNNIKIDEKSYKDVWLCTILCTILDMWRSKNT